MRPQRKTCSWLTALLTVAEVYGAPAGRLLGSSFGIAGTDATYDYVIVGGGTAGLALASRLVEQTESSVAVVEAGTFYELGNGNRSQIPAYASIGAGKAASEWQPHADWGYMTTPQAGASNQSLHYPRGRMLGGCSGRNYMIYQRPTVGSCQMWADAVGDDSYTFDRLLPYYEKSLHFTPPNTLLRPANATPEYDESVLGSRDGPVSLTFPNWAYAYGSWAVKGLEKMGIALQGGAFQNGSLLGHAYSMFTIDAETMTRSSSETAFLRPSLQDPALTVYDLTTAKKILFDANKTATGVVVDTLGREYTLRARNEIILSGGVIGSPQLLQASGVGPAALLARLAIPLVADRPGVGQNLQDHIVFGLSHRVHAPTASAMQFPAVAAEATRRFLADAAGPLTSPATDVLAWEKLPAALRATALTNATRDLLAAAYPADWPEVEYIALSSYLGDGMSPFTADPADGTNYATLAVALITPRSRGAVTLATPDTRDHPRVDPAFLTARADVEVAVAGFRRAREFWAAQAALGFADPAEAFPGRAGVESDAEIERAIRANFQTIFHGAGTCAMGRADDPMAVVDSRARVLGVRGVRVVDAAAFPFLPPGHPMSTVYALAEKIACDISGNCP